MLLTTSAEFRLKGSCDDTYKMKCCYDSGEGSLEEACAILSETIPNLVDRAWTREETDQYFDLTISAELRLKGSCDDPYKMKCCYDCGEVSLEKACVILSVIIHNHVDRAWTREETNQYFDMCERFDLRFIVITDSLPSSVSVEELKSHYAVSQDVAVARAPTSGDVSGNHVHKCKLCAREGAVTMIPGLGPLLMLRIARAGGTYAPLMLVDYKRLGPVDFSCVHGWRAESCMFCSSEETVAMIPSLGPLLMLVTAQAGMYTPLMVVDCRGLEPMDFSCGHGWRAESGVGRLLKGEIGTNLYPTCERGLMC